MIKRLLDQKDFRPLFGQIKISTDFQIFGLKNSMAFVAETTLKNILNRLKIHQKCRQHLRWQKVSKFLVLCFFDKTQKITELLTRRFGYLNAFSWKLLVKK